MSSTLGELFANAGARFAANLAIVSRGRQRTFAEVIDQGWRLAHALRDRGLAPGAHVAVPLENRVESLEVYVGLALGGYTAVHVNDRLTASEIDYIITDSKASGLIYTDGLAGTIAALEHAGGLRARLAIRPDPPAEDEGYDAALAGASAAPMPIAATPGSIAIIGYTSGTTGFPKGVLVSNAAVVDCVKLVPFAYRLPLRGHAALPGSWAFVSALWGIIFPHFYTGGTTSFIPGATPEEWGRVMAENGSTFTLGLTPLIPGLLAALRSYPQALDTLQSVLHSGGPLPPQLAKELIDVVGDRFVETWGMTEVIGPITITTRADCCGRSGASEPYATVGRPLPTAAVRVAGPDGASLPPGEVGELVISADTMFSGYHNQPDRTAEVLRDGEYFTGDLGYRDANGYFYVTGRVKELIISGGANVYPAEVERVLLAIDGVADAAVFGMPDEKWGESVAAAIVTAPGAELDAAAIQAHVRRHLAGYKKPTRIYFVPELPRNSAMKVMKHVLRDNILRENGMIG